MSRDEDSRNVVVARRIEATPVRYSFRSIFADARGRLLPGRMSPRPVTVGAIVLACLLLPVGTARAQLDARERPRVTGPLAFLGKRCDRRVEWAGGRIIATSRSCLRLYAFDPARENNSSRNFGVVWMQSNVDARRRWCATEAKSVISFPRRVRVLGTTPGDRGASRSRLVRARLRVDNAADKAATIQNVFRLNPQGMRTGTMNDGTSFHATWRGSTRRALGFALGVELSWEQGADPPSTGSLLDFAFKRSGSC